LGRTDNGLVLYCRVLSLDNAHSTEVNHFSTIQDLRMHSHKQPTGF
jgi:hypothetical protein